MAAIVAVKSGNWSDPTVWHLNRIPEVDDVVYANTYTVNIDISTTVQSLSNSTFFGLSAVPIMTGYTTPSGIASAQNEYSIPQYTAWKAFDGNWTGNDNHWIGRQGRVLPEWLQYEFASPKVIVGYSLQTTVYDFARATDWEFQAWNGSDWVALDTNVGSPSQAVPYVRTFTNSTAYSRYRIYITNSNNSSYIAIAELRLFETPTDAQNAAQGGGFILNPNVSLTCTEYIEAFNATILTWTGGVGTTSSVTTPILYCWGTAFIINGQGTLNLNIALTTTVARNDLSTTMYSIRNSGTVNLVGSITSQPNYSSVTGRHLDFTSTSTGAVFNMTGDLTQIPSSNIIACYISANITYNQIGNITLGVGNWPFNLTTFCTVNITGTLTGFGNTPLGFLFYTTAVVTIVGPIVSTGSICTVYMDSSNTSSIFLVSGPFIYSPYGYSPIWAPRYHLIPTTTSYIEFADSTTGGLPFPGAIAPRAQFISPSASSDSPAVEDVRFGVSYAYNSLTGTLRMPHPNQVTYGVAVDNTFGNAVLTAASVWDYLVANITVENSIGMRLKNVATPQTVGAQLASLL